MNGGEGGDGPERRGGTEEEGGGGRAVRMAAQRDSCACTQDTGFFQKHNSVILVCGRMSSSWKLWLFPLFKRWRPDPPMFIFHPTDGFRGVGSMDGVPEDGRKDGRRMSSVLESAWTDG